MIINKVYHLADLHIRNLQRHKEYKLVFNKFLKQVKQDNIEDSLIYIAGDIAHAKTEMSPELIDQLSRLFKNLSDIVPTIIIAGNHDCNLNNLMVLIQNPYLRPFFLPSHQLRTYNFLHLQHQEHSNHIFLYFLFHLDYRKILRK